MLIADQFRLSHHRQPIQDESAKPKRAARQKAVQVDTSEKDGSIGSGGEAERTEREEEEEEEEDRDGESQDELDLMEESAILLDTSENPEEKFDDFEEELEKLTEDSGRVSAENGLQELQRFLGLTDNGSSASDDTHDEEDFSSFSSSEDEIAPIPDGWDFLASGIEEGEDSQPPSKEENEGKESDQEPLTRSLHRPGQPVDPSISPPPFPFRPIPLSTAQSRLNSIPLGFVCVFQGLQKNVRSAPLTALWHSKYRMEASLTLELAFYLVTRGRDEEAALNHIQSFADQFSSRQSALEQGYGGLVAWIAANKFREDLVRMLSDYHGPGGMAGGDLYSMTHEQELLANRVVDAYRLAIRCLDRAIALQPECHAWVFFRLQCPSALRLREWDSGDLNSFAMAAPSPAAPEPIEVDHPDQVRRLEGMEDVGSSGSESDSDSSSSVGEEESFLLSMAAAASGDDDEETIDSDSESSVVEAEQSLLLSIAGEGDEDSGDEESDDGAGDAGDDDDDDDERYESEDGIESEQRSTSSVSSWSDSDSWVGAEDSRVLPLAEQEQGTGLDEEKGGNSEDSSDSEQSDQSLDAEESLLLSLAEDQLNTEGEEVFDFSLMQEDSAGPEESGHTAVSDTDTSDASVVEAEKSSLLSAVDDEETEDEDEEDGDRGSEMEGKESLEEERAMDRVDGLEEDDESEGWSALAGLDTGAEAGMHESQAAEESQPKSTDMSPGSTPRVLDWMPPEAPVRRLQLGVDGPDPEVRERLLEALLASGSPDPAVYPTALEILLATKPSSADAEDAEIESYLEKMEQLLRSWFSADPFSEAAVRNLSSFIIFRHPFQLPAAEEPKLPRGQEHAWFPEEVPHLEGFSSDSDLPQEQRERRRAQKRRKRAVKRSRKRLKRAVKEAQLFRPTVLRLEDLLLHVPREQMSSAASGELIEVCMQSLEYRPDNQAVWELFLDALVCLLRSPREEVLRNVDPLKMCQRFLWWNVSPDFLDVGGEEHDVGQGPEKDTLHRVRWLCRRYIRIMIRLFE